MISSISLIQPNPNFQALKLNRPKFLKSGQKLPEFPVVQKSKFIEKISGAWTKVKNEYSSWDDEIKEYFWKDIVMLAVLSVAIAQILRIVVPVVRWFNNLMDKL